MLLDQSAVDAGSRSLALPGFGKSIVRTPPALRSARRAVPAWVRSYRFRLIAADTLGAAMAGSAVLATRTAFPPSSDVLLWACLLLALIWPVLLATTGAYSERLFGTGSEEYRRVSRAGLLLLASAGFMSYAAELDLSRALVVVAVPALTVATLAVRASARYQLGRARAAGRCVKRTVVVGRGHAVLELAERLRSESQAGLEVVAACVPSADLEHIQRVAGVPVGGLDDVLSIAATHHADTVAVTSASETAAEYLRRLSWQLEGSGLELLVAPGLIEVAGPRLHIRPFEGLPLLTVEAPRFEGWHRVVKGGVDRLAAAVALILLAPVLLTIAAAVRLSDAGPVLYRQERVGVHGRTFTMLKFRSMVTDADSRLNGLLEHNEGSGLLFKMRLDPRVTPVGRWLRRFSLDELPQLFNVLGGTMSLVGPRPPLPHEVERYDSSVRRRLLVKPGLTGLWQISGRSDLSWEESVRLDLRYVENWSLALDLLIIWKTAAAVLKSRGAY